MEQEKKNVYVCPVCGRFTKKAAVDKYNKMLSTLSGDLTELHDTVDNLEKENAELNDQIQKETTMRMGAESELTIVKNNLERSVNENTRLQTKISNHDAEVVKLRKTIDDQAKHITGLGAEVSMAKADAERKQEVIEKLYARSLWQRILNIIPE